jgi:uncharacterized membrane protein
LRRDRASETIPPSRDKFRFACAERVVSLESSHTIRPRTLAALAYLGGWVTGVIVWLVERRDREVRFHAAQAMVVFGALSLLWAVCWVGSFIVLTVSATGFSALQWTANAVLLLALGCWMVLLWGTWRGGSWRVPAAAAWARRLAAWRAVSS